MATTDPPLVNMYGQPYGRPPYQGQDFGRQFSNNSSQEAAKSGIAAPASSAMRNHMVAASAEFVGTFMFLWLGYCGHLMAGAQASETAPNGGPATTTMIAIALSYSFALLPNVWAMYRVSGGMFNPAVTIGLCLAGAVPWVRGAVVIPFQFLAAIAAGFMAHLLIPIPISHTNTTLAPGVSVTQGLFIEVFLTSELVFIILMLAVEKHKASFVAPLCIGLALFVSLIAGAYFTGGSLNPARSVGSAVAARSMPNYHWIYWVGPLGGASLAAGYHRLLNMFHYQHTNPGQDGANGDFMLLDIN